MPSHPAPASPVARAIERGTMYIVFADATYVLMAVVALSVGFGLCVAGLMLEEAFNRVVKTLGPIRQATEESRASVRRRPQSSIRDSAVAQSLPVQAASGSIVRRASDGHQRIF